MLSELLHAHSAGLLTWTAHALQAMCQCVYEGKDRKDTEVIVNGQIKNTTIAFVCVCYYECIFFFGEMYFCPYYPTSVIVS